MSERLEEIKEHFALLGELNEFLQKRRLPPGTLGRHVVDVVMDYVEELEKKQEASHKYADALRSAADDYKTINKELHDRRKELRQQNKRYREVLGRIKDYAPYYEMTDDVLDMREIARRALESESE